MNDIFCKIIAKEVSSHIVYEDEVCIAIMDKFPIMIGQVVLLPKAHVDYFFDLDEKTREHLFRVTEKIARALDTTYSTLRTCIAIEGFEVPHAHIKMYPRTTVGFETISGKEKSDAELAREAEKIRKALG